jgi:hypothetical protein
MTGHDRTEPSLLVHVPHLASWFYVLIFVRELGCFFLCIMSDLRQEKERKKERKTTRLYCLCVVNVAEMHSILSKTFFSLSEG